MKNLCVTNWETYCWYTWSFLLSFYFFFFFSRLHSTYYFYFSENFFFENMFYYVFFLSYFHQPTVSTVYNRYTRLEMFVKKKRCQEREENFVYSNLFVDVVVVVFFFLSHVRNRSTFLSSSQSATVGFYCITQVDTLSLRFKHLSVEFPVILLLLFSSHSVWFAEMKTQHMHTDRSTALTHYILDKY